MESIGILAVVSIACVGAYLLYMHLSFYPNRRWSDRQRKWVKK